MRKATMLATAVIAVLALSVGALAYPVVVGAHPLSLLHTGTPAIVTHPKTGDDNSTGNQTNENETGDHENETGPSGNETGDNETGDSQGAPTGNETGNETSDNETGENETSPVPPAPEGNETENESEMFASNVTVDHNVTVSHVDNTTWVNGTITVSQNGTVLVTVTFQIVAQDNGTANATINVTQSAGSETIAVHGFAFYSSEKAAYVVFGVVKATQNGSVLWWRPFVFGSGGCSGN